VGRGYRLWARRMDTILGCASPGTDSCLLKPAYARHVARFSFFLPILSFPFRVVYLRCIFGRTSVLYLIAAVVIPRSLLAVLLFCRAALYLYTFTIPQIHFGDSPLYKIHWSPCKVTEFLHSLRAVGYLRPQLCETRGWRVLCRGSSHYLVDQGIW